MARVGRKQQNQVERFWGRIGQDGECWLWLGKINKDGSISFWDQKKNITINVRSLMWKKAFGFPLPRGEHIINSCGNRLCLYPGHMTLRRYDKKTQQDDKIIKKKSRATPIDELFWRYVDKNGPIIYPELGPCWVWTGSLMTSGYGSLQSFSLKIRMGAHRYSFMREFGPFDSRLNICHKCDLKVCVNPFHLFAATQRENLMDMVRKGRWRPAKEKKLYGAALLSGENKPNSKLTWGKVREIRKLYKDGYGRAQLARMYGVGATTIFSIVHNLTWKMELGGVEVEN